MTYFTSERTAITPQELGRLLDISTASVEELAVDLVRVGLLERDASGAYRLADNDHLLPEMGADSPDHPRSSVTDRTTGSPQAPALRTAVALITCAPGQGAHGLYPVGALPRGAIGR